MALANYGILHRIHSGIFPRVVAGLVLLIPLPNVQAAMLAPALPKQILQEEAFPESSFSPFELENLKSKQVIFVDGIMNELAWIINNYFYDSRAEVSRLEISFTHTGYSSRMSVPENAELLYEQILTDYQKRSKPVILIGHSMGGAEALYCILKHPELMILNIVERVVILEGAIGGSNLTHHMENNILSRGMKSALDKGLVSLQPGHLPGQADANFQAVFRAFRERLMTEFPGKRGEKEYQRISHRVFYIRSYHPMDLPVSPGVKAVQLLSDTKVLEHTHNDGVLTLAQQKLQSSPAFGHDMGILKADHIELVVSGLFSHSSESKRRALTRVILHRIYSEPREETELDETL